MSSEVRVLSLFKPFSSLFSTQKGVKRHRKGVVYMICKAPGRHVVHQLQGELLSICSTRFHASWHPTDFGFTPLELLSY